MDARPPSVDDYDADALGRGLSYALVAVAAFGLFALGACWVQRVPYAYPLEWMEGASLQHAQSLARGELPYAAPSAELIAYVYPPLAYVPVAVTGGLFGWSLPVARVSALACALAALVLIALASARLSGSRAAGLFSAGLFAYGFGYGGAFLDLVRVDACFVLCIAAAAERLSAGRPAAALYWLAASALAKQHGAILLMSVSLAWLARERERAIRPVIGAWLAVFAAYGALQLGSGGWFLRYAFEVPGRHGLEPALLASFVLVDLLVYLPVLTLAAAFALARRARTLSELDALLLGAIAASALGRAHPGGDDNVRLPALALLCVVGVAPLAVRALRSSRAAAEVGVAPGTGARVAFALALCAQAALLFQPPVLHAPRAKSARRFDDLKAALARCADGRDAVALDYALLTGEPFLHTMALSDLRLGGDSEPSRAGTRALLESLRGPRAPAAIAVGERFPELQRALDERYALCADLPAPRLPTGYQPGPRQQVYSLRPTTSERARR